VKVRCRYAPDNLQCLHSLLVGKGTRFDDIAALHVIVNTVLAQRETEGEFLGEGKIPPCGRGFSRHSSPWLKSGERVKTIEGGNVPR
jgi:hypothetical protein